MKPERMSGGRGGGGGETRGCHSTLHSDHKDHKKP